MNMKSNKGQDDKGFLFGLFQKKEPEEKGHSKQGVAVPPGGLADIQTTDPAPQQLEGIKENGVLETPLDPDRPVKTPTVKPHTPYPFRERSISYMDRGGIFCNQSEIPKLPIPKLEHTCKHFLTLAKLLLGNQPKKQAKTEKAVQDFLSGLGPRLQQQLQEYDQTVDNYLDEFWSNAYLIPNDPIPINVNPYFLLEQDPTPGRGDQVGRASSLVFSMLRFIGELWNNTLRPDIWRKTPLCMSQYPDLFGSHREPSSDRDLHYTPKGFSRHIVVLSRGQFYYFDVLDEFGEIALSEVGIRTTLEAIVEDSAKLGEDERAIGSLGVLTSEERNVWAKFREDMISVSDHNKNMLDIVDKALFIVCLDDVTPASAQEEGAFCLHGSYRLSGDIQVGTLANRWYDKLCLIVFENGVAGINFEHSAVDGHTVLRMASDVFADTIVRFAQSITRTIYGTNYVHSVFTTEVNDKNLPKMTNPKKIEWRLNDDLRQRIFYAETKASDDLLQVDHKLLEYHRYGKDFITRHKLSPDGFIQMSILVAYIKLFGEVPNIYESVQTKHFLKGRTEAGRTITQEAVDFAKVYCKNSSNEQKIEALRSACLAHSQMIKRCAKGNGIDRHLFALKCMKDRFLPDEPMPEIFLDEGWKLLSHNTISTSNCGNPSLRHFGFGPVVPDGFGVGYVIKEDALHYACSSKHRQTQRFLVTIERYLNDMYHILEKKTNIVIQTESPQLESRDSLYQGYGMWDNGS